MSPFFKKKDFFTADQKDRIIAAIRAVEQQTSGEIRVFVEGKNPLVDPVDQAKQVFHKLNMANTKHRNAVLIYIAIKHRELALFADEGIYKATGTVYWNTAVREIIKHFKGDDIVEGIVQSIFHIGQILKEKFPSDPKAGRNELPGDMFIEG
jgi:uncharacterized membrane protein